MRRRKSIHELILYKYISRIVLLSLLIPTLSACAKSNSGTDPETGNITANTPNIVETTEIYYREEPIPIPDGFTPLAVSFLGREVFLFDGQRVLVTDQTGHFLREAKLLENESFQAMDLQPDRSFWCVSQIFSGGGSSSGSIPEKIDLVHFARDGAELDRISVNTKGFGENEEQTYFRKIIADGDYFYLMSYQALYIVDESGQIVMEARASGGNLKDPGIFNSVFRLDDGRITAASTVFSDNFTSLIQIPDPKEKEIEEIFIPAGSMENIFATGKEADILLCTVNGFFDLDLGTMVQSLVFDNLKYGLNLNNIVEVTVLSDGSIAVTETSQGVIDHLARFVPYVPSDETAGDTASASEDYSKAEGKITLTLSRVHIRDSWLSEAAAGFNRSNKDYRVEVKDYTMNNLIPREEAVTKFKLDITAGNIPDIIMLPLYIPSSTFINKGMFLDLNEFIENDPAFNRDDYLPNVFEALELDGRLYEIFPVFDLDIIKAKAADVDTEIGWTLDEFAAFLDSKPDTQHIFTFTTKRDFIARMIRIQFINPQTGETRFERDGFRKILAVAGRFPDAESNVIWHEHLEGLGNGDPLMYADRLSSFSDLKMNEYFYFREAVAIKGWPSMTGNGLSFSSQYNLSITSQSENPDGAWEFIKYVLDNAKSKHDSDFPVNIASFEAMGERQIRVLNDPSTTTTNGVVSVNSDQVGFGDDDVKRITEIVKMTKVADRRDPVIEAIVMEEVDSYLGGQKSADQVADIIENRIGIYLAEQE